MQIFRRSIFLCFLIFIVPQVNSETRSDKNLFVIEKISIEGNTKTRSEVIYENLSFAVGDTLSEPDIFTGIEALRKTQFFKDITFQPRAGSEAGNLNLTLRITERRWPSLRFKGGFSELTGWYITPVSLNFDNLFGRGNFSSLNYTIGDRISHFSYDYLNPNLFQSGLDFYFNFFARSREFLTYIEDERLNQRVTQSGFFIGFRSRNDFAKHFLFGLDFYATAPDSFMVFHETGKKLFSLPQPIDKFSKETISTGAVSVYFDLDKRNRISYPTRGWWLGMGYTLADSGLFDSDHNFSRFIFDVRKYQEIVHHAVLAVRVKYGTISPEAPFYEKFYLGGPNTLRGFADRSLSPIGGGEQLYQASLELRFPITRPKYPDHFLTGVIFLDSGANFLYGEKITDNQFESSYGFGFRFRLPFIRYLRLDFARPWHKNDVQAQLSIGHTF